MVNVLYIHGMGGGADSRIPALLRQELGPRGVDVIVRTYDFDPVTASGQIAGWVTELSPSLIIGESLGALHAIRIKGIPHILISPSLNAPLYFSGLAWMTFIPGITALLDRIYRPREGDRQPLHFTYRTLKNYSGHRKAAIANSPAVGMTISMPSSAGVTTIEKAESLVQGHGKSTSESPLNGMTGLISLRRNTFSRLYSLRYLMYWI